MDDLAGIDWSKDSRPQQKPNSSYSYNASAFAALKPTPPTSGRVTPLNGPSSQPPSKPVTPANDSFSNLIPFSSNNSKTNVSLQEQQRRVADLKIQNQRRQAGSMQNHYAPTDDHVWNNLGSGRSTPVVGEQRSLDKSPNTRRGVEEDDIFSAFGSSDTTTKATAAVNAPQPDDDDDPFGLSEMQKQNPEIRETPANGFDDQDVLGLLGEPVKPRHRPEPTARKAESTHSAHPQDRAVAELVDMGFPVEKAKRALETTDSGTDVQAAVGWLLNQAHEESGSRPRGENRNVHDSSPVARRRGDTRMQTNQRGRLSELETPSLDQQKSESGKEKDPAQLAAEFGNNFLKTAGTFWKQGTKKFQQAVQELNSDSDSGQTDQPKWMREPEVETRSKQRPQERDDEAGNARRRRRSSAAKEAKSVTDEAMMLEASRPTPPPRPQPRSRAEPRFESSADNSRDHSPVVPSRLRETTSPQPAFMRQQQPPPRTTPLAAPRTALSRQDNEDQAAQAYVSLARRRRPEATLAAAVADTSLLEGSVRTAAPPRPSSSKPSIAQLPKAAAVVTRPPPPLRQIPPVSDIKLKACHSHREKGNESFKRGDYSSAHSAYATSISHLPPTHPLVVVLLTNRALTALKIGEPKLALNDSDTAIKVIGPSKGESETVDFENGEPPKPMRDYYGKALVRKAEALEQMERWSDAAAIWREAVEGGHGGATSMQGRLRAEKAANPAKPKPRPSAPKRPTPTSTRSAPASSSVSNAAVNKLRAANAAADKADDEKFALSDSVDARLTAWRNGKQENLRALLGSLDTVLWPEAGWKKISMADLVLPGKVKIQYMKGIGKVHPDKVRVTQPCHAIY